MKFSQSARLFELHMTFTTKSLVEVVSLLNVMRFSCIPVHSKYYPVNDLA